MREYTEKENAEITEAIKKQPKNVIMRKVMAVKMSMEKQRNDEISKMTGYNSNYIYEITAEYQRMGMEGLREKRVGGNHRSFSAEKEAEMFESIKGEAQEGKFPRGKEIREKVEKAAGKEIPLSTFYKMMERQNGRKVKPRGENPKKASKKKIENAKIEITDEYRKIRLAAPLLGLRPALIFEDEAGFGRISSPEYCWVFGSERPVVPAVRVRQYRYFFGAVEPLSGEFSYDVYEKANTDSYNDYLSKLSHKFSDCLMLLIGDGASYHTSNDLVLPDNIRFYQLPPATPEMNPTEQCWREIRTSGFKNKIFPSLKHVISNFAHTVADISNDVFRSITLRNWLPLRC